MLLSTMASEGALDPNPSVRARTRAAMTIGTAITQRRSLGPAREMCVHVYSSVAQNCAEEGCQVRQRLAVGGLPLLEAPRRRSLVARSEILRQTSSSCAQSGHDIDMGCSASTPCVVLRNGDQCLVIEVPCSCHVLSSCSHLRINAFLAP